MSSHVRRKFLVFSGTVSSGEFKKNDCFLAFTVQLMGGKLREFERISSCFLAFPGTEYSGVFQCHRPALFAHSLSQSEQQKTRDC